MNSYIDAQCRHMIAMVQTFEDACHFSAKKDDNKVSKDEEKTLRKIKKASDHFKRDLEKITGSIVKSS